MRQVTESHPISLGEIRTLAEGRFGDMIKGVVDLERGILLLDADLHAATPDRKSRKRNMTGKIVSLWRPEPHFDYFLPDSASEYPVCALRGGYSLW